MDALDLLVPLLTNLDLAEDFELRRDELQEPVGVWAHRHPNGGQLVNEFGQVNFSIVNAISLIARLQSEQNRGYMTFGDFVLEEMSAQSSPSPAPILVISDSPPGHPGIDLYPVPLYELLIACGNKNAGVGVTQSGQLVVASAEFVKPVIEAINYDLIEYVREHFYDDAVPFNFHSPHKEILQQLIDSEAACLASVDCGGLRLETDYVMVMVLNFHEDVTFDESQRVKKLFSHVTDQGAGILYVLSNRCERDLGMSQAVRMKAKPLDLGLDQFFQ